MKLGLLVAEEIVNRHTNKILFFNFIFIKWYIDVSEPLLEIHSPLQEQVNDAALSLLNIYNYSHDQIISVLQNTIYACPVNFVLPQPDPSGSFTTVNELELSVLEC